MKYSEKKYNAAIAALADQLCAMVKEDNDNDDEEYLDKELIWDECGEYISAARQDLDEELDAAYDRVFTK